MVPGLSSPAYAAVIVPLSTNFRDGSRMSTRRPIVAVIKESLLPGHPPAFEVSCSPRQCWRTGQESNLRLNVLQTFPLPLGYPSKLTCREPLSKSLAAKLFLPLSPASAQPCA